jgi:poly-gamma-glutamate capsule biosynthesis protein CapA/YwtB (metallophosphatase superfamily)
VKSIVPKTVGGENSHPPRSIFVSTTICLSILVIIVFLFGCQANPSVTIGFLGDISLGRDVTPSLDSFAYLQDHLSTADIVLANLESPLSNGDTGSKTGYNLCSSGQRAPLLAEWGMDLLSLANNHFNDCSPTGISETQSFLSKVGVIGLTSELYQINEKGIELSFFAFDDVSSEIDMEAATTAITTASSHDSFVVVSMHWGMEYQGAPSDRQQNLAVLLADAGADLIWGHHPHVLQQVEWIETSRGKTLVLYSLGNALFDQGGLEDTRQSALLLVNLDSGRVKSVEAVPFEIDVPLSKTKAPSTDSLEEILFRLAIPGDLMPSR